MKPVLLCSHSSQCFNKIISRNTLDKLRMDYHRIKVRKQSSKCSHSSQCFRTLIRYIVSIWIPALYLLLSEVIPLRMISWQIIFRKLKSVCLLRAQRFRNIICHNSLGEIADGLSSNQSPEAKFKVLAALAMLPDFDSIYRFDMDSGFIYLSVGRKCSVR